MALACEMTIRLLALFHIASFISLIYFIIIYFHLIYFLYTGTYSEKKNDSASTKLDNSKNGKKKLI